MDQDKITKILAALDLLEEFDSEVEFNDEGQLVIYTGIYKGDWTDLDDMFEEIPGNI